MMLVDGKPLEYVEGYRIEGAGGALGTYGISIMVSLKRELTEADETAFDRAARAIQAALHEETIRLDPASAERAAVERAEMTRLFPAPIYVEAIPNGYCSDYCCRHLPWFVVTTVRGRIKVGWRKRVIQIDWSDSAIQTDAETLFPDEDVTKGGRTIHAWGVDKARAYVARLLEAA